MCEISFEFDFLFLVNGNFFADMSYWEMTCNIIDNNAINARQFETMLLVNILSISVADEVVTHGGLVKSGQKLWESNKFRKSRMGLCMSDLTGYKMISLSNNQFSFLCLFFLYILYNFDKCNRILVRRTINFANSDISVYMEYWFIKNPLNNCSIWSVKAVGSCRTKNDMLLLTNNDTPPPYLPCLHK